ncbi:hypothetical protein CPB86DRAFT_717246 [Serendipita vermifera]|nr:hypothetical protein CPB86DRAFT_717246 [Serendipita vermifera]
MASIAVSQPIPATYNYEVEHDRAKQLAEKRACINQTVHLQKRNQRTFDKTPVFPFPTPDMVIHPKWRRHHEDYVNPHLLPHERDPVAPRYGQDLPSQRVMPKGFGLPGSKCRCEWCLTAHTKNADALREANKELKKLTAGGVKRGPHADWDWNGRDDPYAYDDHDWMLDYADDKAAPEATLDLLAIAKPAKKSKRQAARHGKAPQRLARAGSTFVALPEIDEISALDYEETWERLDLDKMDLTFLDHVHAERDDGSEWDWDRCSQF